MPLRVLVPWVLVLSIVVAVGVGSGCHRIEKVGDWIVGFATTAGKFVERKAQSFSDAVARAWEAIFPTIVSDVRPDPPDTAHSLTGTYDGNLTCKAQWGSEKKMNELSITLDHPRMVRTSPSSQEWTLAPEADERIMHLKTELTKSN